MSTKDIVPFLVAAGAVLLALIIWKVWLDDKIKKPAVKV